MFKSVVVASLTLCGLFSFTQVKAQQTERKVIIAKPNVADSVKAGMEAIAKKIGKPSSKLKYYVMMDESTSDYSIHLCEYSQDKNFKSQNLIDSAKLFLKISDTQQLPGIFSYDLYYEALKKAFSVTVAGSVIKTHYNY